MGNLRPGDAFTRQLGGRICDDRDRAILDRLIDKAIAVGSLSLHGDEKTSGLHPTRVVFHTGDVGVSAVREKLHAIQKILESHWGNYRVEGCSGGFADGNPLPIL